MEKNDFWQTPRGAALKKLFIWGLFFILVFTLLALESQVKEEEVEEENPPQFVLYNDMLKEIDDNNYQYNYNIKINETTYILEGQKDGKQDLGILESDNTMFKYLINEEGIYKINLKKLEAISSLSDALDNNIINLNFFKDKLKENYHIEKDNQIRKVIYDNNEYSLVVTTNLEHIEKIEYKIGIDEYNLEFSNFGKISEINLDN